MKKAYFKTGLKLCDAAKQLGFHHSALSLWVKQFNIPSNTERPFAELSRIAAAKRSLASKRKRATVQATMKEMLSMPVITEQITDSPERKLCSSKELVDAYKEIEAVLNSKTIEGIINQECRLELKDSLDFLKESIFEAAMKG